MMRPILAGAALLANAIGHGAPSGAAEGGLSHYLPGLAGDIAIAASPAPGAQYYGYTWGQFGSVDRAVFQGAANFNVDADIVLGVVGASYTFPNDILGGTYTLGAAIPFGYAALDGQLAVAGQPPLAANVSDFNLSDIVITPIQLNYDVGNWSFKIAEAVIVPTGDYSRDEVLNLGRNYWSFDTVGAVTYFNTDTGTELSMAPGIMINTTNRATDYRTGTEFHVDFTVNQFLSPTFALGLRGYYYRQLTGDSGDGAILGDFKSESLGIGPGFFWSPASFGGKLSIFGKWMHDVRARRRFEADYGTLGIAYKF